MRRLYLGQVLPPPVVVGCLRWRAWSEMMEDFTTAEIQTGETSIFVRSYGSGTLVTFPVLLWAGLPPVGANVANNIGLAPGSVSGAVGYRKQLSGSKSRVVRFSVAALLGGAVLCWQCWPPGVFRVAAPVLIAVALVLVVAEPWLGRRLEWWRENAPPQGSRSMVVAIFATSVYVATSARGRA
jgi:uncharacterized membrane protein YfcA